MPPTAGLAGNYPADRLAALVARQPLVLVVGASGPGRSAALTVLAGPAAGGTMIDLGALWMAVDPPGDRPRTVRLNGAPSTVGGRGWEAIAGAIGAVAVPPAVVLVDTFQGLVAALGAAGAAETITALVAPGRTVVVVLDELTEAERFQDLALRHGVLVAVDGPTIRRVHPVADLLGGADAHQAGRPLPRQTWSDAAVELASTDVGPVGAGGLPVSAPSPAQKPPAVEPSASVDRRWRWWRRSEPAADSDDPYGQADVSEPLGAPPVGPPPLGTAGGPGDTGALDVGVPAGPAWTAQGPAVAVTLQVGDTTGTAVDRSLAPGGYYLIQLAMRAAEPGPDVAEASLAGAWVQVAVIAESVTVPAGPHAMFVPRQGGAWTCPCQPGGPHMCLPEERAEQLELPFVAPRRPDLYRVHVAVRHRSTVIHQTRLELPVGGHGVAGPSATVTYEG